MNAPHAMGALAARDIIVSVDGTRLLDGVTCAAARGRVTGLIGPNGAGKSTLLRSFLRLQAVDSGQILFGDRDITTVPPHRLGRDFAYLAQGQTIHWPLSVEAVAALGRDAYHTPFARMDDEDQAAVAHALSATGLEALKARPVTSLSGGEKARALLARVLASEAGVILADEPVAALDPYHQLAIMELLHGLAHDGGDNDGGDNDGENNGGRSVVIVLHDLGLARRFCDDVILLHRGTVAASGPAQDIITPEHLEPVYRVRLDFAASGAVQPVARLDGTPDGQPDGAP
ncbi:ABC transporter ATP-binding protein [Eilatimonas milleporae]|uniref:Iron complex transport system ATP-binding protein n=1 Tax=Eilatimonas milleporae TaxID=911205 RepID=A0A3M0CPC6_9PROT|nr:ABC transporter ATP-binding protein [Eilatimonas milleporae]RMB08729.1 iron complex transport system ATP-binding protein [Eilatimonas milleporae]